MHASYAIYKNITCLFIINNYILESYIKSLVFYLTGNLADTFLFNFPFKHIFLQNL